MQRNVTCCQIAILCRMPLLCNLWIECRKVVHPFEGDSPRAYWTASTAVRSSSNRGLPLVSTLTEPPPLYARCMTDFTWLNVSIFSWMPFVRNLRRHGLQVVYTKNNLLRQRNSSPTVRQEEHPCVATECYSVAQDMDIPSWCVWSPSKTRPDDFGELTQGRALYITFRISSFAHIWDMLVPARCSSGTPTTRVRTPCT